jgi:predicted DNA-binding transcriptional regulator AlpA
MRHHQTALDTGAAMQEPLLTPKEAAAWLNVSLSFLAKARKRGDGPPFIPIGRGIRYSRSSVIEWARSQQRLSTKG